MYKEATVYLDTLRKIKRAADSGQINQRTLNGLMIELGEKHRIPYRDSEALLSHKINQYPKTRVYEIDVNDASITPSYFPATNEILTYNEPWAFLHEYGHVPDRATFLDKIKRNLPIKHKLTEEQSKLINGYINSAYMSGGDVNSQRAGQFLKKVINDTSNQKERNVWRLTEEIRANARAHRDASLTGTENANKVLQPLAVSDLSYMQHFYPEEFDSMLASNTSSLLDTLGKNSIFKAVDRRLDKIRNGLLYDWEKLKVQDA